MPNKMPFERHVDYRTFSVNVDPSVEAIARLSDTLNAIVRNHSRLHRMQRALWEVRRTFDWTDLSRDGTFFATLLELASMTQFQTHQMDQVVAEEQVQASQRRAESGDKHK